MPELPEVETMRRGVEPIVGAKITAFERLPCPRKPIALTPGVAAFRRRVEGAREEPAIVHARELVEARAMLREQGVDAGLIEPAGDPAQTIERLASMVERVSGHDVTVEANAALLDQSPGIAPGATEGLGDQGR